MTGKKQVKKPKAWVVTVDMGYGHQRAAYPLRHLAYRGSIVNANTYAGIPHKDRKIWKQSREMYEKISRFKKIPLVGNAAFAIFDTFQAIEPFYPKRDLSKPTLQLRQVYGLIHKGWGKALIQKLGKNPLPLITTFFIPAYMAEEHGYPGDIYLVVCDADVSRAWAPLKPRDSRIHYLAPSRRVVERLQLYGVPKERISYTGFPLPLENIGTRKRVFLKSAVSKRIGNLDPRSVYRKQYHATLAEHMGKNTISKKTIKPLTLMFAVGGVGAQRELGAQIIESLRSELGKGKVRLNLVAGVHNDVNRFFKKTLANNGLSNRIGKNISIIYAETKNTYFTKFNHALRTTDILWTKPSELSFYCALGLPIIIAPPIGSQEKYNRKWLKSIGAGMDQEDPHYTNEWLSDWVNSGWFAEAAMQGYLEAQQMGVYNIEEVLLCNGS